MLALGCLQSAGYIFKIDALRGIGSATAASPLPVVFSDVKGLETFASRFVLDAETMDGQVTSVAVTPELYARFAGPYNRRNVYGAAISYGPRLPEPLWKSVLHYGLCEPATLARELGIAAPLRSATVHLQTLTAGRDDRWDLKVSCNR